MTDGAVLLFSPLYPPYRGGGPNYFVNLAASLVTQGEDVYVLTSYHTDRPFVTVQDGVEVYRVVPRIRSLPRPIRALFELPVAFIAVFYFVLCRDVDVIHAHSTSLAVLGVAAGVLFTRTPIVYDCRDEEFPRWLVTLGRTLLWFSCAPNIDKRLERAGVPTEAILRVPVVNPSYVNELRPPHPPEGRREPGAPLRIAFVGRLRAEKGVLIAIQAVSRLQHDGINVKLDVIGDGPDASEVAEMVRALGLSDVVRLSGELGHESALNHMKRADVVVLPSANEGLPRVIVEAFTLGVPVVATDVGSVSEVLIEGKNGYLTARDSDAVAAALSRLVTTDGEVTRLARGAWDTGSAYTWGALDDRVLEAYNAIRAGEPSRSFTSDESREGY
jgi:glycosyltransferase involved in cell wall biosynthesis